MSETIAIRAFTLGVWQTNCYVMHDGVQAWIVDAGFEPQPMLDYLREHNLTPTQVVLTHAHLDHIAGLTDVRAAYPDIPILVHEAEKQFLTDPALNLSIAMGEPIIAPQPTRLLTGQETLALNGVEVQLRHTPGHSPGGICLIPAGSGAAIVGDTLFAGSIGRFDFPTSDGQALAQSIREQIYSLPDDTRVLPGHGPETTVGQEKRTNPYVRG